MNDMTENDFSFDDVEDFFETIAEEIEETEETEEEGSVEIFVTGPFSERIADKWKDIDITDRMLTKEEFIKEECRKMAEKQTAFLNQESYTIISETVSEETAEIVTKCIDGYEALYVALKDQNRKIVVGNPVREYKGKVPTMDIKFDKPVDANKSFMPTLIFFLSAVLFAGGFFGVQANSYYIYEGMKKGATPMECAFGWITVDNLPVNLSPFNTDVFFTAFGVAAGILAVIGIFIYLDNDTKKQSRVGHEHGNARLGTASDFKKFRMKFMD